MKLVVSLDVEADNQWDHGAPLATHNVRNWAPFQDMCERHGVVPTYLLTSEIVADDRARELLGTWQSRGVAEIGAHLHPWTTPPFGDAPGLRFNDPIHAFPCELPTELLGEKIDVLTRQIAEAFAHTPTAFRAGRFGFDARVARGLQASGYVVDSSVTPLTSWRGTSSLSGGGPDFSGFSVQPFRIEESGQPGLVEVPVTVMETYRLLQRSATARRVYGWLPVRALRKTLLHAWLQAQPMWLTPHPHYGPEDLVRVWRCAEAAGLDVAVMMFHSSELMPGGSPFRPTAEAVGRLFACLDGFFAHVRTHGGTFAGLTDAALSLAAGGALAARRL